MRTSLLFVGLLAACSGPGFDDADRASDEGDARGDAIANQARHDLDGASGDTVVAETGAIVLEIDDGVLAQAHLAIERGDDPDVIAYARAIVAEHERHIDRTNSLLGDLDVEPTVDVTSETVRADFDAATIDLQASTDFDYDYVTAQIRLDSEAVSILEALVDVAPYTSLAQFYGDTRVNLGRRKGQAMLMLREQL